MCVSQCGAGFYLSSGHQDDFDNSVTECLECQFSCDECHGPAETDCTKCGVDMVKLEGKCLVMCPDGSVKWGGGAEWDRMGRGRGRMKRLTVPCVVQIWSSWMANIC